VLRLSGVIAAADGSSVIRAQTTGGAGDGDSLGRRLAQTLLLQGGAALLDRSQPSLLIATKNGGN
jgi:porphobilinogen deaminase